VLQIRLVSYNNCDSNMDWPHVTCSPPAAAYGMYVTASLASTKATGIMASLHHLSRADDI
jgi:hypothetical protein